MRDCSLLCSTLRGRIASQASRGMVGWRLCGVVVAFGDLSSRRLPLIISAEPGQQHKGDPLSDTDILDQSLRDAQKVSQQSRC